MPLGMGASQRVVIDPRSPVEWGLLGKGTNTFDAKVRIARLSDGPRPEVVLELEEDDLTKVQAICTDKSSV